MNDRIDSAKTSRFKVYKRLPEWTAQSLPAGFRRQHNTKEGTWARLTVNAGALRFFELAGDGEILSSRVVDAAAGPHLVEPGVWHKVEPIDAKLRCELAFLCEPDRYLEKKHGLTAPHSEVRELVPALTRSAGRTVLDLGSGRGRNSFYLAERGFSVTSVDRSTTAIEKLRQIEADEGFSLDSHVYDVNRAALAELLPDGIDHVISTVVFQLLDRASVPAVIDDMQSVTHDAGLHLIVAPVTSAEFPCPIDFPFVPGRGELREHYRDWEMLRYDERPGEFHKRDERGDRYRAEFATLIARKPGPRG